MKKGFTLVELLGVIAIIAILSVIAVPAVLTISRNNKENMFCKKVQTIERAAQLYGEDNLKSLENTELLIDSTNSECDISEYDYTNNNVKPTKLREDCEMVNVNTLAVKSYLNYESNNKGIQNNIFDPRDYKSMLNNKVMVYIIDKRVHAQYIYKNKKDAQRCISFMTFQNQKTRNLYYRCGELIRFIKENNTSTKEDSNVCPEPPAEEENIITPEPENSNTIYVDFDVNGGTPCTVNVKEVTLGEDYGTLCTTEKDKYVFEGWELIEEQEVNEYAEDGSILSSRIEKTATVITPTTKVTKNEDHTLTASWSKKIETVEVTYDSNGGTPCNPNKKEVIVGEKYGELCYDTTKPGFNFAGWYLDAQQIDSTSTVNTPTNHTLVAKWNPATVINEPIQLADYPDGIWLANLNNDDLAIANTTANPPRNVYQSGAKPTLMQASQCTYKAGYEYGSRSLWEANHYCVKNTLNNTAQLRFVDSSGSDITRFLTNWTSSNTSVVTVSSTGLVSRVGAGIATVTASLPNGHTKSETVYVYNAAFRETAWPVSNRADPYAANGNYYIFGSTTNVNNSNRYSRDLNYLVLEAVPYGTCKGRSYYYKTTGDICSCAKILATSYGANKVEGHMQKNIVGKYTEIDPYYDYHVYWYYFNLVTRYKETAAGSCRAAKSITKVYYRPNDVASTYFFRDP